MPYKAAYDLQKAAQTKLIEARESGPAMEVFLVEHDPVVTITRRPDAASHLLASPELLHRMGVVVEETDRGGDITYHGPGQLVVYPVLDLNRLGLRIHSYMRLLEEVVMEVLASFGVKGERDACATGVWVRQGEDLAKVCAMGVRVSRWVSMHGLALNVDPDLSHFGLIVPCGLAGRPVTSLKAILGDSCPTMTEVKDRMMDAMESACARCKAAAS
jgi:lipoyl(octanoyl) transferase